MKPPTEKQIAKEIEGSGEAEDIVLTDLGKLLLSSCDKEVRG
jgi:hypothetical protein